MTTPHNLKTFSVGVIGMGSFGMFTAQKLSQYANVLIYSNDSTKTVPMETKLVSLKTAVQADFVILAVPLGALPNVLRRIGPHLSPETLLIDVCSVKVQPTELYRTILPNHAEVLLTHPLFGPESAHDSTAGHTLIVTNKPSKKGVQVLRFCRQQLGLTIYHTTTEAHDKAMAEVHALTFFIARTLNTMQLEKPAFTTPSFRMLEDLINYDRHHSDALFETMELGNPYAQPVRDRFVHEATRINKTLEK